MAAKPHVVYLAGARGSGKTTLATGVCPVAEVGFVRTPNTLNYPWPATSVTNGQQVWPGERDSAGGSRVHCSKGKNRLRELLCIPIEATICRVSGDGFMSFTEGNTPKERGVLLGKVLAFLKDKYDYIICDMSPRVALRSNERIVYVATHPDAVQRFAETKAWGGRTPFSYKEYLLIAQAFFMAYKVGNRKNSDALWHDGEKWSQVANWIQQQIIDLAPWYCYHEFCGIPVGDSKRLNGAIAWRALRSHLGHIAGVKILDIGANSGYNTLAAAAEGAYVTAIEADNRYCKQLRLAIMTGDCGKYAVDNVNVIEKPVQQIDLKVHKCSVAILSKVHYHIARSSAQAYRVPKIDISRLPAPASISLTVVLEDLLVSASNLVIVSNLAHARRELNPYPDVQQDWIIETLRAIGYTSVRASGAGNDSLIVTARGGHNYV